MTGTTSSLLEWNKWDETFIRFSSTLQQTGYDPADHFILTDGFYDAQQNAIGCLSPGLDQNGNVTFVGDQSTFVSDAHLFTAGYVATVALNGQNFDHEPFQVLYLTPPRVHEVRDDASGRPLHGGLSTDRVRLRVSGSHWAITDTISLYREPTLNADVLAGGVYPNTLSCVFYAPMSAEGIYRFVNAEDVSCNGTMCEATCLTPTFSAEEMKTVHTEGIMYTQVFMSMNRRDPCMACGCQKIFLNGLVAERKSLLRCVLKMDLQVFKFSAWQRITKAFLKQCVTTRRYQLQMRRLLR